MIPDDRERRRRRNEDRKRLEAEIEAAVRKLKVDWTLFQSSIARLEDRCACHGDLRACRRILKRMSLSKSEIAIVLEYLPLQGGDCDCEVFYNVDMTNPQPLVSFDCIDCGGDYDEFGYMITDAVWAASGLVPNGGLLCIGCIERRLGRRLTRADFKLTAFRGVNEQPSSRSLRLRNRLGTA